MPLNHKGNIGSTHPESSDIHSKRPSSDSPPLLFALPSTRTPIPKSRSWKPCIDPDLSARDAYEELRSAARAADYQTVQGLVKLLVNDHHEKPNPRLYHALILANADSQHGNPQAVDRLLREMEEQDITPDSATYHAALKVLAIHPDYVLRQQILEGLNQRWFSLTTEGWHDFLLGLIRDRQLEVAMNQLETIRNQGVPIRSWLSDILVYAFCEIGELDEALKLIKYRMSSSETWISPNLWAHFLDTCSRSLHYRGTQLAWRTRVETGYFNPSSGMCINILNTAARHGDAGLASDVFRVLEKRNHTFELHHYEALLESWLASRDLKSAFLVLCEMALAGTPPSKASTRAIFLHLAEKHERPAEALDILRSLVDSGHQVPHAAINCIIDVYVYHSDLASAIEVYHVLHTIVPSGPNTSTFNALFRGCSYASRKDLAMFLASEMLALKVPPNALTYDRLVATCLNADPVGYEGFDDAWKYFEEMKSMGWWPRVGTLRTLAIRGCLLADERVVQAVVDEERGLTQKRMTYYMLMYWRKVSPNVESGDAKGDTAIHGTDGLHRTEGGRESEAYRD
ncbi:MAG: hypothetical protein Q9191_003364 [Dirinaria sp. TL-2023a]